MFFPFVVSEFRIVLRISYMQVGDFAICDPAAFIHALMQCVAWGRTIDTHSREGGERNLRVPVMSLIPESSTWTADHYNRRNQKEKRKKKNMNAASVRGSCCTYRDTSRHHDIMMRGRREGSNDLSE